MLKGIKAVAQQTGTPLPPACELYLAGANGDGKVEDFPLTWSIMLEAEVAEMLGG